MLLLAMPAAAQAPAADIDFEGLSHDFVEERCGGSTCGVDAVLADHFVRLHLGAYELYYPTEALGGKGRDDDLHEVLLGIVDLQAAWIERLAVEPAVAEAATQDIALVREWIDDWRTKNLKKLAKKGGGHDLFEIFEASDDVRSAEQRLAELLHDGKQLALPMEAGKTSRLVLSPTRLDFMRWLAFGGDVEPTRRNQLYVDGSDQWTQFWTGWTAVLAMEYSPWSGFDPKFRSGKSMKDLEKSGLVEQITLQAGMALVRFCVNRDLDHPDNAIVMNMVIEIAGQLNTVDGEGQIGASGGRTRPYSRFVPGGNPNGGTLPKRSAAGKSTVKKSRWRDDNGADFFLAVLRDGQQDGGKQARKEKTTRYKDRTAHFQLMSDRGKHVVTAPFFGEYANLQQYPPQEFLIDYGEFFRAYKSGFFHWLRWSGAGVDDPDASLAKFRELMGSLADLKGGKTFEQAIEEIYGVPLSGADETTDSLEWRFLAFLEGGRPVALKK